MKFSAFTVKTVSRVVTGTPTSGPRDSVPMSATGTNRKASCTPSSTITPAAAIWPVSLVSASRPNRSSRTPSRQISPPAARTAIVWVLNSKLRCSEGSWEATSTPAATPRYMATPPPRGVGMTCTSRSRTAAITRKRTAATRTTGVARNVTSAATRRTTAYSRIGQTPRRCVIAGVLLIAPRYRCVVAVPRTAPRPVARTDQAWSIGDLGDDGAEAGDVDRAVPEHPGGGGRAVDDGARCGTGARSAVQDDGGVLTQLVLRLGGGVRRGAAGAVRAGDRQRPGPPQQVAGDVVVGQPDGDGPLRLPQVPGE